MYLISLALGNDLSILSEKMANVMKLRIYSEKVKLSQLIATCLRYQSSKFDHKQTSSNNAMEFLMH